MSTAYENPPFERGKTFYGGRTIDTSNPEGLQYEGKEYEFNDENPSSASVRSNRKVRCRIMRNWDTAALLPKQIVKGSTVYVDSSTLKERAVGAGALDVPAGVIDEYLPAAGVPIGDLCMVVIKGPSLVTSANSGTVAVLVGTRLVTAASGRAIQTDYIATSTSLSQDRDATLGHALQAANTNTTDFVANIELW
jgi:hypothetical protein